jgi:hypothetical protein
MCFSATANFVGSGVLAAVGVLTLTRVKHRRELLFASLPTLFAVHQFIEGFVWLGLDGILSPQVANDMGAAFMLYAQGILPFLLPLSVLLFEPDKGARLRMRPFLVLGTGGERDHSRLLLEEPSNAAVPLCGSAVMFAIRRARPGTCDRIRRE